MISTLFLSASLSFTPADARCAWNTAKDLVQECTPRDAGTIRGRIASNRILDAASATGADVRRDVFKADTPDGVREFINLYAMLKSGDSDVRWVILVSHYDTKAGVNCPGANDGASTSGLLVGIANAYSSWEKPKGNLLLIWTDGEECMNSYEKNDGLWGSKRAAEFVYSKKLDVQAVICLDMLGDKDLTIMIPANGSPTLAKIAMFAAKRAGYPTLLKRCAEHVIDDHVPFMDKGYKAIDLIDFNYGPNNSYWHSPNDTLENISIESITKSGKVVVEMLNILL